MGDLDFSGEEYSREGAFLFTATGDGMAFASVKECESFLEFVDVINREYIGMFTWDGRIIEARVVDERVYLVVRSNRNESRLVVLLADFWKRSGWGVVPESVEIAARRMLEEQRKVRWLRRLRWLGEWVRGNGAAPQGNG